MILKITAYSLECLMGRKNKNEIVFDNRDARSRFLRILTSVKTYQKILREDGQITLAIKPEHTLHLRNKVIESGLKNCPVTQEILRRLDANPTEFIQFRHYR